MSKQIKYLFVVFAILLAMNLLVTGCQISDDGEIQFRLNPKTAESLEKGGETGIGIAKILAPFFGPAGGIVVGGLASGLALFKKFKPKLTQLETKAEMSYTVATISVDAIETLKKEHPKIWADCVKKKISEQSSRASIDTKVLENFVRGLRGLSAKT